MEEIKQTWWRCKSRMLSGKYSCPCQCRVKVNFQPKACLWSTVWEVWEKEKKEKKEKKEA